MIDGKLKVPDAFETRLYVNTGTAGGGGNTGVWELGLRQMTSANISVLYEPRREEAVGLGFYSFYRASTSVSSQYLGASEIGIRATAHYHGYEPRQEELRTESVLVDFGRDPLRILEQWVDTSVKTVHPNFNHDARTGTFNTWFVYGDAVSESQLLQQAKLLRDSFFPQYGITLASTGEWQAQRPQYGDTGGRFGFGEDQVNPKLYPHGVKWLIDQLHELGLQADFGANYAYASLRGTMAQTNAPWLIQEDLSCTTCGYPIDFTHPGAQEWLFNLAKRTREYAAAEWWTDFDVSPNLGKLHDPTKIMGFEDIREGLRVTREAVGPNVLIHKYCCGPYFTYLGLVDRARVGDDAHPLGDFEGLKAMARQLAGNYMLHQHFWISDPDPVFVGGRNYVYNPGTGPIREDPSFLGEIHMRLLYQLASGGFLTIGENLEDLDAERRRLLTLVLPIYGQAARPLDLFLHTTPEVYDLPVKTSWDQWHVVMLQNWNTYDKEYNLSFSELGLEEGRQYALFRFWDQRFLGEFRSSVSLKVGAQTGEAFLVRELPAHPWVLATDMHLTQGGVELRDVQYDASTGVLSGVVERHPGAEGHVVVYVPTGYKTLSASSEYREESHPAEGKVVYLQLKLAQKAAPWSLTFGQLQ